MNCEVKNIVECPCYLNTVANKNETHFKLLITLQNRPVFTKKVCDVRP